MVVVVVVVVVGGCGGGSGGGGGGSGGGGGKYCQWDVWIRMYAWCTSIILLKSVMAYLIMWNLPLIFLRAVDCFCSIIFPMFKVKMV